MSEEQLLPKPERAARLVLKRRAMAMNYLAEARQRGDTKDIQQWEAFLRAADAIKVALGRRGVGHSQQKKVGSG